jgi:diketogulonate reductase-like aldo/keto reductase
MISEQCAEYKASHMSAGQLAARLREEEHHLQAGLVTTMGVANFLMAHILHLCKYRCRNCGNSQYFLDLWVR